MNKSTIVVHSPQKDPKQWLRYTIVAILKDGAWHFGVAVCHRGDQFSRKAGVTIALERANNTMLPHLVETRKKVYEFIKGTAKQLISLYFNQLERLEENNKLALLKENGWESVLDGLELAKEVDGVWYRATLSNDSVSFPAEVGVKGDNDPKETLMFYARDVEQFIKTVNAYYEL